MNAIGREPDDDLNETWAFEYKMSFNPAGKQSQESIFSKKRNKHSSTNASVQYYCASN